MKKRILAFTLVLAMTLFCFAGCGKKQEAVKDTPDKTMTDVTLNIKEYRYGFCPFGEYIPQTKTPSQ